MSKSKHEDRHEDIRSVKFTDYAINKYQANFDIEGKLEVDDQSEIYKAFADVIVERLPGLATLLRDRSVSKTGHISINTIGMRYVFQIGFLF